jgi:hypothetical protein
LCSFCLCRKWDLEQTSKPNTPPFANWIKGVIHRKELDLSNLNDLDAMLLCNKPSQVALRYTRLKAYGNHFSMDDAKNKFLQTYDNAIASIFEQQIFDAKKCLSNM